MADNVCCSQEITELAKIQLVLQTRIMYYGWLPTNSQPVSKAGYCPKYGACAMTYGVESWHCCQFAVLPVFDQFFNKISILSPPTILKIIWCGFVQSVFESHIKKKCVAYFGNFHSEPSGTLQNLHFDWAVKKFEAKFIKNGYKDF